MQNSLGYVIHRNVFKPGKFWSRRVAVRALLRTAREVAAGMAHLHSQKVVHGDLAPANVLLSGTNIDRRGFTVKASVWRHTHCIERMCDCLCSCAHHLHWHGLHITVCSC